MVTEEQTNRFLAVIRKAAVDIGINKEDRAALMVGAAHAEMELAFGVQMAARQIYMLALALAKKAGLDDLPSTNTRH